MDRFKLKPVSCHFPIILCTIWSDPSNRNVMLFISEELLFSVSPVTQESLSATAWCLYGSSPPNSPFFHLLTCILTVHCACCGHTAQPSSPRLCTHLAFRKPSRAPFLLFWLQQSHWLEPALAGSVCCIHYTPHSETLTLSPAASKTWPNIFGFCYLVIRHLQIYHYYVTYWAFTQDLPEVLTSELGNKSKSV